MGGPGDRYASFARIITFDRRGTGLSDPVDRPPTLDQQMDDLEAVAVERVALIAAVDGGLGATYAATHPNRVTALVLVNIAVSGSQVIDDERREQMLELIEKHWGEGQFAQLYAPERARPAVRRMVGALRAIGGQPLDRAPAGRHERAARPQRRAAGDPRPDARALPLGKPADPARQRARGSRRRSRRPASWKRPASTLFEGFTRHRIETSRSTTINLLAAGTGPGLLLLHGCPETLVMWHKIAPA